MPSYIIVNVNRCYCCIMTSDSLVSESNTWDVAFESKTLLSTHLLFVDDISFCISEISDNFFCSLNIETKILQAEGLWFHPLLYCSNSNNKSTFYT